MHFHTIMLSIFSYAHTADCHLTQSFESQFIKVKYSDNWKYFSVGGTHTLMYYEESNFERREEAEITFSYAPAPDKTFLRDTATLATRYVSAKMAQLKDALNKKFEKVHIELMIEKETRVRIANTIWSKVVVNYSGTDEHGETKKGNNCFYLNFSGEGTTLIRTNHYYPEIKTVNRELPCILSSVELKKIFKKKS